MSTTWVFTQKKFSIGNTYSNNRLINYSILSILNFSPELGLISHLELLSFEILYLPPFFLTPRLYLFCQANVHQLSKMCKYFPHFTSNEMSREIGRVQIASFRYTEIPFFFSKRGSTSEKEFSAQRDKILCTQIFCPVLPFENKIFDLDLIFKVKFANQGKSLLVASSIIG